MQSKGLELTKSNRLDFHEGVLLNFHPLCVHLGQGIAGIWEGCPLACQLGVYFLQKW